MIWEKSGILLLLAGFLFILWPVDCHSKAPQGPHSKVNCDVHGLHFRSRGNGFWHEPTSWETSADGNNPWILAEFTPNATSDQITIRQDDTIFLKDSLLVDQLRVEGILEIASGGVITFTGSNEEAAIIETNGILLFNFGAIPQFENLDVRVRVKTGGTVRVDQSVSGISQNLAGNQSKDRFIYEDGAVFNWNATQTFTSSGQVYFPGAAENIIPIFRVTRDIYYPVGAGGSTTINGLFEAHGDVTWRYAGRKTFRNGITGSGNVIQHPISDYLCGPFHITGNTANLGGSGTIHLNSNGLVVSSENLSLSSDKIITDGTITFNGLSEQKITGEWTLQAMDCVMANLHGLSSATALRITGRLTLAGGNINTHGGLLEIGISPQQRGELVRISGTVIGPVRRWFGSSINSGLSGLFPTGTQDTYNPVSIHFTQAPTGGSITGQFITKLPGNYYAGLPLLADGLHLDRLPDYGLWELAPADGLSSGQFTITVDAVGFPGIIMPENIRILCRTDDLSNWQLEGNFAAYQGDQVFKHTDMETLGQIALAGNSDQNPLPIELLFFRAIRQIDGEVKIVWKTASETNNDYFILERSPDMRQGQVIAMLAGAGNSTSILEYQYIDRFPLEGIGYYRLKQIDFDGQFEYSHWVATHEKQQDSLQVSIQGNAGNTFLKVMGEPGSTIQISLCDIYGGHFYQYIFKPVYDSTSMIVPLPGRQLYIYRVSDGRETVGGKYYAR